MIYIDIEITCNDILIMKYVCNLVLIQLAFWYLSKYDFSTCIITVLHLFFWTKAFFH